MAACTTANATLIASRLVVADRPMVRFPALARLAPGSLQRAIASRQCKALQIAEAFEIAIKAHQTPPVADGECSEVNIGAVSSRPMSALHELVEYIPSIADRCRQADLRLLDEVLQQHRCLRRAFHSVAHQVGLADQPHEAQRVTLQKMSWSAARLSQSFTACG